MKLFLLSTLKIRTYKLSLLNNVRGVREVPAGHRSPREAIHLAAVTHTTANKAAEAFSFRGGGALSSKTRRADTEKDCVLISLEYLVGKLKHWPVGFGNKLIRHFVLTNLSPHSRLISSRFLL